MLIGRVWDGGVYSFPEEAAVWAYLKRSPEDTTYRGISEACGISVMAVGQILRDFEKRGLILRSSKTKSRKIQILKEEKPDYSPGTCEVLIDYGGFVRRRCEELKQDCRKKEREIEEKRREIRDLEKLLDRLEVYVNVVAGE